MDSTIINAIVQFISNVGFPIFAFLAMYKMCNTTIAENTKVLQQLSDKLDKE